MFGHQGSIVTMDLDIFETSYSDCLKSKNNNIHFLNFESLKYRISTLLDYFFLLFSMIDTFS